MSKQRYLKSVSWNDVKEAVRKVAPDIFEAIEILNPDDSYRLYEATYPFGDLILNDDGLLHLPNEKGELVPITHRSIDKQVKKDLGYHGNAMAMALILDGGVQLYTEEKPHAVENYRYYDTGIVLAVKAVLNPTGTFHAKRPWKISSGARQAVLLASTADDNCYRKMKKIYYLKLKQPDGFKHQWDFFRELNNSPNFLNPWKVKLLFFSEKWVEKNKNLQHTPFRLALHERTWNLSAYERDLRIANRIWDDFTATLRHKYITDYTLKMARHVIECALGQELSYKLYDFKNTQGPFNEISRIILNDYQLKYYAPIFLMPSYFDGSEDHYISIKMPTNGLTRARPLKTDSVMNDQRTILYVIQKFKERIINNAIRVEGTPFEAIKNIEFDFFNLDPDQENELLPFRNVIDEKYIETSFKYYPKNQRLWTHNSFIRACIRLRKIKDKPLI